MAVMFPVIYGYVLELESVQDFQAPQDMVTLVVDRDGVTNFQDCGSVRFVFFSSYIKVKNKADFSFILLNFTSDFL